MQEMIADNRIALMIAGPLHPNTLKNIVLNAEVFNEIVVSTWLPTDAREVGILSEISSREIVTVVQQPLPTISSQVFNPANLMLQAISVRSGMGRVLSPNVVKCRSDEYFNLSKFVNDFRKLPNKPLFANWLVREWDQHPFHGSDHLFASASTLALSAYDRILTAIENKDEEWAALITDPAPEQLLTLALLAGQFEVSSLLTMTKKEGFRVFRHYFRLCSIEDLKPYEIRANHAGLVNVNEFRKYASPWNLDNHWGLSNFSNIRQLRPRSPLCRGLRQTIYSAIRMQARIMKKLRAMLAREAAGR